MNTHADKTKENKSHAVANVVSQKQSGGESTFQFVDNRPEAVAQRKLQDMVYNSPQVKKLRAFQVMANNSPQAKQAVDGNSEVVQLFAKAGDTINLEVKPGGPPVFMRNKDIPGGGEEPKSGEIGGTGILDAGSWGTLGVSPRDFHRAHAISNAFGGGGGADNVAWWSSAKELTWTNSEEKVRGGGLAQIDDWKPGDVEKGTYKVTRHLKDNVDFKPGYLTGLLDGASWGLNDSRDAWDRFKTKVGDPSTELTKGKKLKTGYKKSLNNYFSRMLDNLGYKKAGKVLIKDMKMDYNRTRSGSGAGGSRGNLSLTVTADDVDASKFGLKNEPKNLWKAMVSANSGLFKKKFLATGNKRVRRPWGGPTSGVKRPPSIELGPQEDGWGIPK